MSLSPIPHESPNKVNETNLAGGDKVSPQLGVDSITSLNMMETGVQVKERVKWLNGLEGVPRAETMKLAQERKAKFLVLFEDHPYLTECAKKVKVSHQAVLSWVSHDPEFKRRLDEIRMEKSSHLAERAHRRISSVLEDDGKEWIAVKVLETYDPAWKSSNNVSLPVQINISTSIPNPHEGELGEAVPTSHTRPSDATATNPPRAQQDQRLTPGDTVEDGGRG